MPFPPTAFNPAAAPGLAPPEPGGGAFLLPRGTHSLLRSLSMENMLYFL